MSHPFCANPQEECSGEHWPNLGWERWTGKAIYIRATIDASVTHVQACGEAVQRWNEAVGARFLMTPDQGDVTVTFYERHGSEWPFDTFSAPEGTAVGFTFRYDPAGTMLGAQPGRTSRCDIYVNRDASMPLYQEWVWVYAHEIGHAFGLADHPDDDINSVMSYQRQGRLLIGPSWEDQQGVAGIYGLADLDVLPQMLDGAENLQAMWQMDRYGTWRRLGLAKWRSFFAGLPGLSSRIALEPHETYWVRMAQAGHLGYGRFTVPVQAGEQLWYYQ